MKDKSHRKSEKAKAKSKSKSKEIGQRRRDIETAQKQFRLAEQEMQQLYQKYKDKSSDILLKKLRQVNEARVALGLPIRSLDDYKNSKPIQSTSTAISGYGVASDYGYDQTANSSNMIIDPYGPDIQDLIKIPIPKGVPPETEGQIFKSLTQLKTISCASLQKEAKKEIVKETLIQPTPSQTKPEEKAQIVISSAPKLRDLQKELLHLKPASVRKKETAQDPLSIHPQ